MLLSIPAQRPGIAYLEAIDFRVLALLFCLMAVVAGFQRCGLFELLARKLLSGKRPVKLLVLSLVMLPFFVSMLVTNDAVSYTHLDVYKRQLISRAKATTFRNTALF